MKGKVSEGSGFRRLIARVELIYAVLMGTLIAAAGLAASIPWSWKEVRFGPLCYMAGTHELRLEAFGHATRPLKFIYLLLITFVPALGWIFAGLIASARSGSGNARESSAHVENR